MHSSRVYNFNLEENKMKNPKFKVDDLIWKNQDEDTINRIFKIESDHYCLGNCADLPFSEQDEWELLEYHCTGIGKPRKTTGVLARLFKEMEKRRIMKPNKIQQQICDVIHSQADFWKNSNDITSPTHLVDIEEECNAQLYDLLSEEEIEELASKLKDLYWFIRKFDEL